MATHNQTGTTGEGMAVKWLGEKGYTILHRNWRHAYREVDIIASEKNILHFIEVKTRRTKKFGYPEESVSRKKIQNLLDAAENYLYLNPEWKRVQFDVLAVTILENEPVEFFLIEDVYL